MFRHAHQAGLTRVEPAEARDMHRHSLIIAAIFLASIPVALVDATVARFVWICLLLEPLLGAGKRA
jgi:hypothetical protein